MNDAPIGGARAHPPKGTAGRWYRFEDGVGAFVCAATLAGAEPFGSELGLVRTVEFQTAPDAWLLDDVLITFASGRRCCASIKSFDIFRSGSAPADLRERCWRELLGLSESEFDASRHGDLLGLMVAPPVTPTSAAIAELVNLATAHDDPEAVDRHVRRTRHSPAVLKLWESFEPPVHVGPASAASTRVTDSPAEVLRRLLVMRFDFEERFSQSERQGEEWCRQAIGDPARGSDLWNALIKRVGYVRGYGGRITLEDLHDVLKEVRRRGSPAASWPERWRSTRKNRLRYAGAALLGGLVLAGSPAGGVLWTATESRERAGSSITLPTDSVAAEGMRATARTLGKRPRPRRPKTQEPKEERGTYVATAGSAPSVGSTVNPPATPARGARYGGGSESGSSGQASAPAQKPPQRTPEEPGAVTNQDG